MTLKVTEIRILVNFIPWLHFSYQYKYQYGSKIFKSRSKIYFALIFDTSYFQFQNVAQNILLKHFLLHYFTKKDLMVADKDSIKKWISPKSILFWCLQQSIHSSNERWIMHFYSPQKDTTAHFALLQYRKRA
jgi:hypothetical protein